MKGKCPQNSTEEGENASARVASLTEHVMTKQRLIEHLESERAALQLRCESLQGQLENVRPCVNILGVTCDIGTGRPRERLYAVF